LKGGSWLNASILGLNKVLAIAMSIRTVMRAWRMVVNAFNKSLEVYRDNMDGLIRQEAFYANALKYREQIAGEALNTGAKTFQDYQRVARRSIMETRKNIDAVAEAGIVSFKELNVMTGQLASFQIDTDAWFAGDAGRKHIESLADLMASIQNTTGSRSEALRVANMIGKAVTMGQFGQLQRWGIVLSDSQKQIIKTGTTAQRLSAIMEGLEQNVGNFNNEMSKTPYGKLLKVQNQINKQYFDLGQSMIYVKIQLLKLWKAFLPFLSNVMKVGGAILGVLVWALTTLLDAINWLFTPFNDLSTGMNALRFTILAVGSAFMIAFAPMLSLLTVIGLIIEDIWMYFNGGESATGYVIEWFKSMFSSIKESSGGIINSITSFFGGVVDSVIQTSNELRQKVIDSLWAIHIKSIELFLSIRDSIRSIFTSAFDYIVDKFNGMIEKIKGIKNKIPFLRDEMGIETPSIGENKPIADLGSLSDKPNVTNGGSTIKLELKMESGAVQQSFSSAEILTVEDVKRVTEQSLETSINNGMLNLLIDGGILQ
ncbi:MAG: hypothetical protein ACRCXT_23375, partial [Paraclostridium sp.]